MVTPLDAADAAMQDGRADGPTPIPLPNSPVRISARNQSCAIRRGGEVWCWARGTTARIGSIDDAVEVAMTADDPCVLHANGTVSCATLDGVVTPVEGIADATHIAGGSFTACALRASGRVSCWSRQSGQSSTLYEVAGIEDVVEIGLGWVFGCARRRSGIVACWGENAGGQLGDGTMTPRSRPEDVEGVRDAVQLAVGASHVCVLDVRGSVTCWGQRPTLAGEPVAIDTHPVAVTLEPVRDLTAGYFTTCAIALAGNAYCWGLNVYGELGDGAMTNRAAPSRVMGVSDVVAIAPGHVHTCFEVRSGAVSCVGYGFSVAGRQTPVDGLP